MMVFARFLLFLWIGDVVVSPFSYVFGRFW